MSLSFVFFWRVTHRDGRTESGRVRVPAARNEREAGVLAAERLRWAGKLGAGDRLWLDEPERV